MTNFFEHDQPVPDDAFGRLAGAGGRLDTARQPWSDRPCVAPATPDPQRGVLLRVTAVGIGLT
jgi:hypothetical protein